MFELKINLQNFIECRKKGLDRKSHIIVIYSFLRMSVKLSFNLGLLWQIGIVLELHTFR